MKYNYFFHLMFVFGLFSQCKNENVISENTFTNLEFRGGDLSYVNEMEDCGAVYKSNEGISGDPYQIMANAGMNLVRFRLWHSPQWTNYSTFTDVKKGMERAKSEGLRVLLDFHYSDDWADPQKQEIPAAWANHIGNTEVLKDSIYNYTYKVLSDLGKEGLLPEMVQVGNEINPMLLQQGELTWPIDWNRNAQLINSGISAVRDIANQFSEEIEVMLHIAQPENGLWWFKEAKENGVTDFDWIGLSYYPKWSKYKVSEVSTPLRSLISDYDKKLMIVETAYPYSMTEQDAANNILGNDALLEGYPATQEGQFNYLKDLSVQIQQAGGRGLVYWEPAWVSTDCSTRWGKGSHWDNATLFDANGRPTQGMQFFDLENL